MTVDYAVTRITVRPDQMDGAPCIRSLRVPVATVAGNFKRIDPDSRPVSEIPEDELVRGVGE